MKIIKILFILLGCSFLLSPHLMAQDKKIKAFVKLNGSVVDETGSSVPGVTIRIKDTSKGTATDINGKFKLRAKITDALIVSYIGYETQTVPVNGRKNIEIELIPHLEALEEVVVVGYGKQDVKEVTGSIESVEVNDQISSLPTPSFEQMLQGRMAGVQVFSSEGGVGQSMSINIRGANTITGTSDPLYVIDGFPLEDPSLFTLHPSDIERYDVLKDASATAIYGSRGSNGVVLITTKQGLRGKTTIKFNTKVGVSQIPQNRRLETLNAQQYVQLQHDLGNPDPWGEVSLYSDEDMTNWQEEIFRKASFQDYNISMSGGSDLTKFYTSLGYLSQEGTLINTGFKRITGRIKLDQKVGKKVQMKANINYTNTEHIGQKTSTASVSAIKSAILYRPMEPKVDDLELDDEDELRAGFYPPTRTLNNTDRNEVRNILQADVRFDINILKGLKFSTNAGYQLNQIESKLFFNSGTNQADKSGNGISGSINQNKAQTFINENILTYNWSRNGHKVNALAGATFQVRNYFNTSLSASQFPLDDLGWDKIGLGTVAHSPNSSAGEQRLMSGLSRVNYTYKNKYIFTASVRTDGSSKFAEANRFGVFPAVSAAWRAGEETFIQNMNIFSDLKFKAGFGTSGNNRLGSFDYLTTMSSGSGYYLGSSYQPAFYQSNLANSNLKWETTQQFNAGVDMGFFNNRVLLDLEYYYNLTDNLLFNAKVASSTGYTQVMQNIGAVANSGFEIALSTVNIDKGDFKWSTNFNISFNKNEVKKLSYGEDYRLYDPGVSGAFSGELYYGLFVGQPLAQMYGYRYDGIYQMDDFVKDSDGQVNLKEGVPEFVSQTGEVRAGMPKYKDLNGDGIINEEDKEIIGNPNPKHFGGLTNTFSYKNWDLSILLTWTVGQDVFNANIADFGVVGNQRGRNYLAETANRWTLENPIAEGVWSAPGPGQDFTYQQVYGGHQMSDYFIEDASYLRVKNITLGYNVPSSVLKKIKVAKMRLYASVDNAYVFTNYSGYDPEVSVKNQAMYKGIDYSSYPASQTFVGGLQVSF